jgi:hypothetical protein
MFILMAARYEDASMRVSKAVAFSDSVLGIHWPEIPKEDFANLRHLANVDPNLIFQFMGQYWTSVNGYSIEATGSMWLSLALLNSLSLPKGQMYVVDSAIERELAGINNIILPAPSDVVSTSNEALRNQCLLRLINRNSTRLADSMSYETRKNDIYVLYYPAANSVCFVETSANSIRIISEPYPVLGGYDSTSPASGVAKSKVKEVKAALWDELGKAGLPRKIIGTKYGIGKTIEDLSKSDLLTDWSLFSRLTDNYSCVECGNSEGVLLFSNDKAQCDPPSPSAETKPYLTLLRKKGFACDTTLDLYIFAKMRFRSKTSQGDVETIASLPPSLAEGSVNISKKCPNVYGVCSTATGAMQGDVFKISRSDSLK